ncbi:MAG: haloacid dehalogenase-like hydrolase [Acidobacteria bacterium]|nr:haloacid dehalogenase-like hydrolase [Acidobacteriota bacterium]
MNEMNKLAVFDVCDTLYYSNTTHDFIRFVIELPESERTKRALYSFLNSKALPIRYLLILISVATGWDAPKAINLRFLRGMTADRMEGLADRFVDQFLKERIIAETNDLLLKFRNEGLRIVLCSSSIEPVVTAVARATGITDQVSSTLIYEQEIFSGRIGEETVGKKLSFLRMAFPETEIEYAVSDNMSDADLLSAARRAIAVVHDPGKRSFWEERRFEIIDLCA